MCETKQINLKGWFCRPVVTPQNHHVVILCRGSAWTPPCLRTRLPSWETGRCPTNQVKACRVMTPNAVRIWAQGYTTDYWTSIGCNYFRPSAFHPCRYSSVHTWSEGAAVRESRGEADQRGFIEGIMAVKISAFLCLHQTPKTVYLREASWGGF